MAYGAKYIFSFSDIYQNAPAQYRAIIYKKDYDDAVYELSCTGTPLVSESDRSGDSIYRPFIVSKATFNLFFRAGTLRYWDEIPTNWDAYSGTWDADNFDFSEFVTADVDTFYLDLQKETSPGSEAYMTVWKGWYIYTSDLTISEIEPIAISLQFSESLLMKVNRYYNFSDIDSDKSVKFKPTEKVSVLEALLKCAYFSGLTDDVRIYAPSYGTNTYTSYTAYDGTINGTLPYQFQLGTMYVYKNAFLDSIGSYKSAYDVFVGILSQFQLTAYFKNGVMYITYFKSLIEDTSRYYSYYSINSYTPFTDTLSYSLIDTVLENDFVFPLNSAAFKNINRDQQVSFNFPSRFIDVTNNGSTNNNLPNHNVTAVSQIYTGGSNDNYIVNNWYNNTGGRLTFKRFGDYTTTSPKFFPFYVYSSDKTLTVGDRVATLITPRFPAGLVDTNFFDTEGVDVIPGDYISIEFLAYRSGKLKNKTLDLQNRYRPYVALSLILVAQDSAGNNVNYIYNKVTGTFDNVAFSYSLSNNYFLTVNETPNFINNSDRLYSSLSGVLDIPASGKLKIRMSHPFHTGPNTVPLLVPSDEAYGLFLETCNIQNFKGGYSSDISKSQTYQSTYTNVLNSDKTISLDSNLFMFDGTAYLNIPTSTTDGAERTSPFVVSNQYGNHILDNFGIPAIGSFFNSIDIPNNSINYSNIRDNISEGVEPILENECLLAAEIQGTFYSYMLPIGTKFTYDVVSYPTKTFVMLDTQTDYKNSTQNVILYSIGFSDPTGKTSQLTVKTS